jgi:hypothetical protein
MPLTARLALVLAALAGVATAPDVRGADRWYVVSLDGTASGYAREDFATREDATRESRTESRIVINRLGARLEFGEDDRLREDADGRLVALEARLHGSSEDTTLAVEVLPGRLAITTSAGGRRYRREVEENRTLLGPQGVRARTLAWLAAPSAPLAFATFATEAGAVVTTTRRFVGREQRHGQTVSLVEEHVDGIPGRGRLVLDANGDTLEEREDSPLGEVRLVLSDEVTARTAVGEAPRAERFVRTLLAANVRLPDPRTLQQLRLRLRLDDATIGWPDLDGPGQRVVGASARERVLEVTRLAPTRDAPPDAPLADPDLQPNVLLQSDDPGVIAIAETLRRPGAGAFALALAARDWVATHLMFDAGLAVVPAGEAVRNRRGTCVAYAVLTASLARALGIPARVVLGYVYLDGVFGGHAWTEVRVGPEWIAIDAAVRGPGSADAARFALVRHGGELGIGSGTLELARLLGHLSVRIEAFAQDGDWIRVAASATPWQVAGRHYTNRWAGITLDAPPGYRYAGLDAHYPDPTLLTMQGPGQQRVVLAERAVEPASRAPDAMLAQGGFTGPVESRQVGGRTAACANGETRDRRACAIVAGQTVWWLEASGADAVRRLPAVLDGLRVTGRR